MHDSAESSALTSRFLESLKWNTAIRIFEVWIRILSSLVIARGLGVRLYGVNASVNSLLTLLPIVLALGFEQAIQVLVPRWMASSEDRHRVRGLVKRLVAWRLGIYSVAGAILYAGAPLLAEWAREPEARIYLRLMVPIIILSGTSAIYGNVVNARLRIREVTIFNMGMQVAGLVAAYFILHGGGGIAGILMWNIIGSGATLWFYYVTANRMLPHAVAPFNVGYVLGFAGVAWLTGMCGQFLQKELDIVVLNLFRIPWEAIAAYNLGASLGVTLAFLGNGVGPLLQGALAEAAQRFERPRLGMVWQVGIKTSAVLWAPLLFFVFCFAPEIVVRFYGDEFRQGVWVFRIMALPQLTYTMLGGSFSGPLFFALGRQRLALFFRVVAGCLNLVLDLALIPHFGVVGAIVATSVAMLGVAAAEMIVVNRLTGALPPVLFLLKWLGAFAAAAIGASLVPELGRWGLLAKLIVYSAVAVGLLRVFRPLGAEERELLARHIPMGRWVFANL